jgi:hypothetical protein
MKNLLRSLAIVAAFVAPCGAAAEFVKAMEGSATKVIVPKPGEAVRF